MAPYISLSVLLIIIIGQACKLAKAESRLDKIRDAIAKACDNANPENDNTSLDNLLKDLYEAMYK